MLTDGSPVDAAGVPLGGRYTTRSVVGRGGMAAVYRARDETLGRDVAIKLFPPLETDAEEMRRQQAELRLAATLNHPCLVTLFDAGTDLRRPDEPRMFLVMEFVDGQDLRKRLLQGPLPPAEVVRIGADIASALHYIHSFGVVHRDIKPANILLAHPATAGDAFGADPTVARSGATGPGGAGPKTAGPEPAAFRPVLQAKLTDFGIARITEGTRLTATGSTVGTAAYLSPEQAQGMPLGPSSDVYSLGLVLLECLTGHTEYPGGPVEAAVARLLRQPQMPAELDDAWGALLEAMTALEPSRRPTAEAVASALADDGASGFGRTVPRALDLGQTQVLPQQSLPLPPSRPPGLAPLPGADAPVQLPADAPVQLRADAPVQRKGAHHPRRRESIADAGPISGINARIGPQGHRPHWSKALWMSVAVVVLVALAVAASVLFSAPAPTTVPPTEPTYPAISGQLGQHLEQLQRSVHP